MSYPSKERVLKVLDKINSGKIKPTEIVAASASPIEKMKFNICQKIIKFKRVNNYSNLELSEITGVGPAVISRILHCQINRFKVDSLLGYYLSLVMNSENPKLVKQFNKELSEFLKDEVA